MQLSLEAQAWEQEKDAMNLGHAGRVRTNGIHLLRELLLALWERI